MNLKSRLLKGLGANAFSQLVTIFIQVVSVPIFLKFWGVELYGEWLILSSLQAYFTMSDIGFSSVAANEMTMLVSNNKRPEALEVFQSSQLFVSVVSLLIIGIGILASHFFSVEKLLNIHQLSHKAVLIIILIMTSEVLINLQIGFLAAGFRCEGEYAKGVVFSATNRFLTFFSISLAVMFGADPVFSSLISLIVSLLCFFLMAKYLQVHHPWIRYGIKHVSMPAIKRLIIPAFAFMAFPIGNALSIQGLITVIGISLGSKSVVVFSTLRTMTRFAWQMMNMINNSVWPELSMAFSKGDIDLVRIIHRRSCQASFWLSIVSIIFLSQFGLFIIDIWTMGQVFPSKFLLYLMLLVILLDSLWLTSSILHTSTNQHKEIALYYLIGSSLTMIICHIFLPLIGLEAAPLSLILIDILMIVSVVQKSMKISQDKLKDFIFGFFQFRAIKI